MKNKFFYNLKICCFIATIILLPCSIYGYIGQGATGATHALYHFCEKSGTTAGDSSGYGNTGTFLAAGEPSWTTSGKFGYAVNFDGTNDYIEVSDATSLDITNAITIEAWVNPSSDSGGIKSYKISYDFDGITNPSSTHIARYFEIDVDDPDDAPPNYGSPVEGTEFTK